MAMPIAAEVGDKITRQYTEDHRPKWSDSSAGGGGEVAEGSAASVDFATHPIHFFFLATSIQLRCVCARVCVCVFKGILSMSKPDATSQRQTQQKIQKKEEKI